MQDILHQESYEGRSIRDIPVSTNRRAPILDVPRSPRRRGSSLLTKILLASLSAGVLAMVIASFFSGATVSVSVRDATVPIPTTIQAQLNAPEGSLSLAYQLNSASKQAQRTVSANGSAKVSTAAQGTITIFNIGKTSPQTLIANTRFSTTDGKIYRINKNVTVPAAVKDGTGALKPSTVQANVVADKAGADYNIKDTRLTIPGFKGNPNAAMFYAQSSDISGGFSGTRPALSSSDLQKVQADLKKELVDELSTSTAFAVEDGFMQVYDTIALDFGDLNISDAGNGKAIVTQAATSTEVVVRKTDLAVALAQKQVSDYTGAPVGFDPASVLVLTASNYLSKSQDFTITISGTAKIVWQFDSVKIQRELAGKNKSTFDSIMSGFAPAIVKAKASFTPIWNTTFPKDITKIKIAVMQ